MPTRDRDRHVNFDVKNDHLVRSVVLPTLGHSYTHRCTRQVFEAVARAIEASPDLGVTIGSLVKALDLPATQVHVALDFLQERTCVVTRGRRTYPASKALFEDAMIEFCFLAELPY